jgi:nitrite reductase/ring-hydroxylating ferredoxin subunit
MLGIAGATAATVGGFLGGHLTFRRAAGVNQAAGVSTDTAWSDLDVDGAIGDDAPTLVDLDGTPLAAVAIDGTPMALFDRCSHLGGPLHEGDLVDGCLRCPWHGSMFRIADGSVARGPAVAPQPAYELRVDGARHSARRRPA